MVSLEKKVSYPKLGHTIISQISLRAAPQNYTCLPKSLPYELLSGFIRLQVYWLSSCYY